MVACSFCGSQAEPARTGTGGAAICADCVRTLGRDVGPASFSPVPGRVLPRFAGVPTFFRLPVHEAVKGADVAIVGIPFDGGTSYRPGTRFAPREMRNASCMGRGYQVGTDADVFRTLRVCDAGDVCAIPLDLAATFRNIETRIGEILDAGAVPLSVGGDHSVTLPILRAFAKRRAGKPKLAVLHFDAHLDTYPPSWGVDFHHGTPFRHLVEEGLVEPRDVIQVGIRGPLAGKDDLDFARRHGFEVIFIDDVRDAGPRAIAQRVERLRGKPVYVSFDIDGVDPAYAPGTGTPVPGGLTTWDCQVILRALKGMELVGMDVVEVSPAFDPTGVTPLVALTMMQEWLGALAAGR
ncbi:MAG: agmatinase [Deltaproteobacteria bacterium]|nr:agmatinase [Deltaproteobacteria bacterium]